MQHTNYSFYKNSLDFYTFLADANTFHHPRVLVEFVLLDLLFSAFFFSIRIRDNVPFQSSFHHPRVLVGFVLLDLQFSVQCLVDRCFVLFLFVIVLSVLRFTVSDYPFGIFKLFLKGLFLHLMAFQSYFSTWSFKFYFSSSRYSRAISSLGDIPELL